MLKCHLTDSQMKEKEIKGERGRSKVRNINLLIIQCNPV